MPYIPCFICSISFYAKPSHVAKGWGKYCSKVCQYKSQKSGSLLACHHCGKETYKTLSDQRRSQSRRYFCSKSCQTIWRNSQYTGKKHRNWTTGESSYRNILKRSEESAICNKCKTTDDRILAVHHKDKDRSNNDISNLVWLCHNCHYLVHHYAEESVGFLAITSVNMQENTV